MIIQYVSYQRSTSRRERKVPTQHDHALAALKATRLKKAGKVRTYLGDKAKKKKVRNTRKGKCARIVRSFYSNHCNVKGYGAGLGIDIQFTKASDVEENSTLKWWEYKRVIG
jgi:hypothetical protein